jgi:hypothetical protein
LFNPAFLAYIATMYKNMFLKACAQVKWLTDHPNEKEIPSKPKKAEVDANKTLYNDDYMAMYKSLFTNNTKGQSKWGGFNEAGAAYYLAVKTAIASERETHGEKITEREKILLKKLQVSLSIMGTTPEEHALWKKRKSNSGEVVIIPPKQDPVELCEFSEDEQKDDEEEEEDEEEE